MHATRPDRTLPARPTQDGAGVKIRRIYDFSGALDPFLLLDELKASAREDYIGGFPPHPHRGFETLTYLIHGGLTHEDSMGNRGEVHAGEAQWMSAARGVIHSEMPLLDSDGLHGFQLWVNLPSSRKMDAPRYRDVRAGAMARLHSDTAEFKAIAGHWDAGTLGSVEGPLPRIGEDAAMADVHLHSGALLELALLPGERLLAFVYAGGLTQGVNAGVMGVWSGKILVGFEADGDTSMVLFKGTPLGEPISHHGPFVMNTPEELRTAFRDYQTGRLATPPASVV